MKSSIMARIHEGISLLSVEAGACVHGVYNVEESDTFCCTTKKSVAVFKVHDPKPIQSWMSKSSAALSCPVVFNHTKQQYVAVANQKQIYRWSTDDASPFKMKPLSAKSPIYHIFPVGGSTIALMMNGSLQKLEGALAAPVRGAQDGPLQDGVAIMDAWSWQRDADEGGIQTSHIVCLVQGSKKQSPAVLILPVPRENQEDVHSQGDSFIHLELDHTGNTDLRSTSFHCDASTATVYTLWEGGDVCSSTISSSILRMQSSPEEKLACNHRFTISAHDDSLKIAALDERHIAVAGVHTVTGSSKPEASLSVWETSYGTLQAHQRMGDDGSLAYLGRVKGHLVVATSKSVALHRYECSGGTLASALGRLSESPCGEDLPLLGVVWGAEKEATERTTPEKFLLQKSKGRKSKVKAQPASAYSDSKRSGLLNDALNQGKAGTSQKFSTSVKGFLSASDEDHPDSTALTLILKAVVKRVEAEPKFWCGDVLHDVIRTGVIAASSCPEFVALLARRKELPLLMSCLSCMRDIPEMTLVQCLQVFLSIDEEQLSSIHHPEDEEPMEDCQSHVISPARKTYVDKVLMKPFTDRFLLDAVKHLQFKEVVLLLRYLHSLLSTPPTDEDGTSQVTMDSVVDWTGILLDAHFAQLVLVADVRPLLASLKDAVQRQVDFSKELDVVRNLLHHTQNTKALHSRPANSAQSYSIRVIKI